MVERRGAESARGCGHRSRSSGGGGARRRGPAIPRSRDRASRSVEAAEGTRRNGAGGVCAVDAAAAPRAGASSHEARRARYPRNDREGLAAGGAQSAAVRSGTSGVPRTARLQHRSEPDDEARDGADQPGHVQGAVGKLEAGTRRRISRGDRRRSRPAAASTSRSISTIRRSSRRTAWRRARARRNSISRWCMRWRA